MIRKLFTLVICCLLVASCTKGGGSSDDDNNSGSGSGGSTEGAAGERNFTTECGTVIGENLRNPANEREGVDVTITSIASHNVVIVSRDGGQQLVRLRGMRNDIPDFQKTRALNLARQFLGSAILFTDGCATTVSGGGEGVVGELFRASDGTSLSEFLILNNAGDGDATGSCGENLVGVCLAALAEEVQPETGATVSNFLWKPQSDKDGNLVVLLNPFGATIVVNGVTLNSVGPSNGRGTTARANRSGGSFGVNVKIQAFDRQGRFLVWPGGVTEYTIPNGSQRLEF